MKKEFIGAVSLLFILSCSLSNLSNVNNVISMKDENTLSIEKVNFKKVEPKILNLASKVINKALELKEDLPKDKFIKLLLKTNISKNSTNTVEIPENGIFKLVFKTGSSFKVLDNNAKDGEAIIQMPQNTLDCYIRSLSPYNNSSKITIEDKLYSTIQTVSYFKPKYQKDDVDEENESKLSNNDFTLIDILLDFLHKRSWYHLGKRPFPIPDNYYNDDKDKYVLTLNNSGIKSLSMRWYKSSNPDYPLGINEVTPEKGGIIELPGVAKITIPPGAVNQKIVIAIKQELNVPEVTFDSKPRFFDRKFPPGKRSEDFVGPVIRVEPFGLKLNKPSSLYLETDRKRLGNNTAEVIDWHESYDKLHWLGTGEIISKNTIKIYELLYFSKQISADISPDAGYKAIDSGDIFKENFNIKSELETYTNNFRIKYPSDLPQGNLENIIKRLEKSYTYYYGKTNKLTPYHWSQPLDKDENPIVNIPVKIEVKLYNKDIGGAYVNPEYRPDIKDKLKSTVHIGNTGYGTEHEAFHLFQLEKYPSLINKHDWITESSAEHMAARVIKLYTKDLATENDKLSYIYRINENLSDLGSSYGLDSSDPYREATAPDGTKINETNYSKTGYMSYLSNKGTKYADKSVGDDSLILDTIANPHLENYQDYAVHSYIKDRLDIGPTDLGLSTDNNISDINTVLQEVSIKNTFQKEKYLSIVSTENLTNLSSKYYKIDAKKNIIQLVDDPIKNSVLSIRVNEPPQSECINTTKISVIKYSDDNETDKNYKVQEIKGNGWNALSGGFKKDYDHIVLVVSNTNGKIDSTSSCPHYIDIGLICNCPKKP